jgi:hypothetical protein
MPLPGLRPPIQLRRTFASIEVQPIWIEALISARFAEGSAANCPDLMHFAIDF